MKLTELNPEWIGASGGREGIGLAFDCPEGCDSRCFVAFRNPIDGGIPWVSNPPGGVQPTWQREGETFETLTLTPSINRNPALGGCGWHGFIKSGEVVQA